MPTLQLDPASAAALSASLPPSTQRIVLTGFMGAGKSTVGRLLANRLGWQFADADQEIESHAGMSVAEIFTAEGESGFRRRESAAIARALGRGRAVIALGGGAPEILANRLLLEQTGQTSVVFLDAPFEVLFDRCVLQEGAAIRPVLMDAEAAAQRFRNRVPHYRRSAHHTIATAQQHPDETAAEVLRLLRGDVRG